MTNGDYYLISTVISRKSKKVKVHTFVEATLWNHDKENNTSILKEISDGGLKTLEEFLFVLK